MRLASFEILQTRPLPPCTRAGAGYVAKKKDGFTPSNKTRSSSYLKRAPAIRAPLRQGYDYDNLVDFRPAGWQQQVWQAVQRVIFRETERKRRCCRSQHGDAAPPVANWNGRRVFLFRFPANKAPPGSHSTLLLLLLLLLTTDASKSAVRMPFRYFIISAWLDLRAPSRCFLKQEVSVPLFYSQTQQVQKAMDEKRFEDAVKLRGRYDRTQRDIRYLVRVNSSNNSDVFFFFFFCLLSGASRTIWRHTNCWHIGNRNVNFRTWVSSPPKKKKQSRPHTSDLRAGISCDVNSKSETPQSPSRLSASSRHLWQIQNVFGHLMHLQCTVLRRWSVFSLQVHFVSMTSATFTHMLHAHCSAQLRTGCLSSMTSLVDTSSPRTKK